MPKSGKWNQGADTVPAVKSDKDRGATLGVRPVNLGGEKDTITGIGGKAGKKWQGEMDTITGMGK